MALLTRWTFVARFVAARRGGAVARWWTDCAGGAHGRCPSLHRALRLSIPEDLVGPSRATEEAEDCPLARAPEHIREHCREDELFASHEEQRNASRDDEGTDDLPEILEADRRDGRIGHIAQHER